MEISSGKKEKRTVSMTEGNPARILLVFALPLMAGNVFQQLYTVTDTAIVGQALGVTALAALGTVDWLNWMILGIIQGVTQGFSILIAQRFGAKDHRGLRKAVGNSLMLSAAGALLLFAAAQSMVDPALRLLRAPAEVIPMGTAYLRVMFCGIPVLMAYNMASAVLRALGDSRTPLYAMIFASILNIGLDLLFVVVFGWGVQGAAAATVIAQVVSAVYCFRVIMRIEILKLSLDDLKPAKSLCGRLLGLGSPTAFQNAVIAVGGMIVQTVVNNAGVAFIAGFTATNKLYGVLEVAATSYGYAMSTYAGQNLGAGDVPRISKGIRAGLAVSVVTSLLIAAVMLAYGRRILGAFISGEGEMAARALAVALRYLRIMSICLPILYVLHTVRSCIQGMGNTVIPMFSGIAEFAMRTGTALFLPTVFGSQSIMLAEVIAWTGADLILIPGYFFVKAAVKSMEAKS